MLVIKLGCIFFRMGQETKSLRFLFCKKRVGPLIVDAYVQIVSVNQIYAPLPAWNLLAIKPCLSSWGSVGLFINYYKTSAKLLGNCNLVMVMPGQPKDTPSWSMFSFYDKNIFSLSGSSSLNSSPTCLSVSPRYKSSPPPPFSLPPPISAMRVVSHILTLVLLLLSHHLDAFHIHVCPSFPYCALQPSGLWSSLPLVFWPPSVSWDFRNLGCELWFLRNVLRIT